jgi:hypothetical protein
VHQIVEIGRQKNPIKTILRYFLTLLIPLKEGKGKGGGGEREGGDFMDNFIA